MVGVLLPEGLEVGLEEEDCSVNPHELVLSFRLVGSDLLQVTHARRQELVTVTKVRAIQYLEGFMSNI